ncbi:hypothetical protein F5Y17DRAFT_439573 [Xylariaceae sp. FL0594]|nr:hypothetical protein F5Y17DRAFT_439573 [Xylariaceae sp. FL0594]
MNKREARLSSLSHTCFQIKARNQDPSHPQDPAEGGTLLSSSSFPFSFSSFTWSSFRTSSSTVLTTRLLYASRMSFSSSPLDTSSPFRSSRLSSSSRYTFSSDIPASVTSHLVSASASSTSIASGLMTSPCLSSSTLRAEGPGRLFSLVLAMVDDTGWLGL